VGFGYIGRPQFKVHRFTSCISLSLIVERIFRELPKKANQALLTDDGQTILVADKFGDVFSCVNFALIPPTRPNTDLPYNPLLKLPTRGTRDPQSRTESQSKHSGGSQVAGVTFEPLPWDVSARAYLQSDHDASHPR
jgi:hypothetical protein